MSIVGRVLRFAINRSARDLSYAELATRLERHGADIAQRFDAAADTRQNREVVCHVIGIERRGQRRIEIALGAPPIQDEYDPYRPEVDNDMQQLAEGFRETRATTIELLERLSHAGIAPAVTAPHNELGELSMRSWFAYLDGHANRESKRIKG